MSIHDSVDFSNPVSAKAWANKVKQLLSIEDWHEVGATGEPGFDNSWANRASLSTAGFYKAFGRVWLKGVIDTGTNGTSAWTLPAGYRPDEVMSLPSGQYAALGSSATYITIGTDGTVIPSAGSTNGIMLDGLSFRI